MALDNTAMSPAGNPNPDPVEPANYYDTQDTIGRRGGPGIVLCTVQPGRCIKVSVGGDVYGLQGITNGTNISGGGVVTVAETAWITGREAVDFKRDGLVSF